MPYAFIFMVLEIQNYSDRKQIYHQDPEGRERGLTTDECMETFS